MDAACGPWLLANMWDPELLTILIAVPTMPAVSWEPRLTMNLVDPDHESQFPQQSWSQVKGSWHPSYHKNGNWDSKAPLLNSNCGS